MKNFILIVFLIISNCIFSQSIDVSGKWRESIRASDISEAGDDYIGTYESNTDETEITIDAKNQHNKNKRTTVKVHMEYDLRDWHSNLVLQIRRTSGGTNRNYNIEDGLFYQIITNNSTDFFHTYGDQEDVPIQYKISGISVLLPVQDYTATIVFTVYD